MKRLFTRAPKQRDSLPPGSAALPSSPTSHLAMHASPTLPSLQPKFTIPAIPHPHPHDHIAILATPDGLLLRPHVATMSRASNVTYMRIEWGLKGKVAEVKDDEIEEDVDWDSGLVVYGLVGVLSLFTGSHLLVITAVNDLGYLFHETRTVFGIKNVASIPLDETRARAVIATLAAKNAARTRASLLPHTPSSHTHGHSISETDDEGHETQDDDDDAQDLGVGLPVASSSEPETPRVKFADDDQTHVLSPISTAAAGKDTDLLSPMSPMSPVAKALANRLSFWTRLAKRPPVPSSDGPSPLPMDATALLEEPGTLDVPAEPEVSADDAPAPPEPEEVIKGILNATAPAPASAEERHSELEDKVVRECIREFMKGDMFFAYTFDITKSLQHKHEQIVRSRRENQLILDLTGKPKDGAPPELANGDGDDDANYKVDVLSEPQPTLPLWRRVERKFWWNEWLSQPFIQAGLHPYVLPIMQGFYQISSFHIPRAPEEEAAGEPSRVDYTLVSRRSRDRAGLRYQRRGVDEDAHVANFVETECVVRLEREGRANVFAYVQVRGSIPLYWTQTALNLKPAPQLSPDRNHPQNLDAIKRHFATTVPKYGPHTIVNLAEQHGKEGAVTQAYKEYTEELADKDVMYTEYDFHAETKGMKYENISKLIDKMERTFDNQGFFWVSDNMLMSTQKAVYRVNCIDCLDRTNVVQSAFARNVLHRQLGAVGLLDSQAINRTEVDVVFNDLWANNGDAISRAYAGTSALKGDFTRTGKRDLGGMLNDGMNSLARMYTSTFSDWFCQAVIDFMLGYRTLSVFSEFLLKLQSTDPRDMIRLSKVRAEAVGTAVQRVLPEGERLLRGWTLFAPTELNVRVGEKFEEKVVLLTAKALYIVSYDYNLEKVNMYVRVPLGDIHGIKKGAYIISPLEEASRDPVQNAGFLVSYPTRSQTTRVTSYSIRNSLDGGRPPPALQRRSSAVAGLRSGLNQVSSGLNQMSASASPAIKQGQQIIAKTGAVFAKILPAPAAAAGTATAANGTSGTPPAAGSPPLASSAKARSTTSSSLRPLVLSKSLTNAVPALTDDVIAFAAFKALPVDPARMRRESGSFVDAVDGGGEDGAGAGEEATTAREAVDAMVDAIRRACEDVGNVREGFVVEEDIVSLAEAQRMTSVYAKMEYGVKRLLWLGGG